MNWKLIDNELPEFGQPILLYNLNAETGNSVAGYTIASLMKKDGLPEWETGMELPRSLHQYTHWMPLPEPPSNNLTEVIKSAADSVLGHHVPGDKQQQDFTFTITVDRKTYQVTYIKDADGYWKFKSYM